MTVEIKHNNRIYEIVEVANAYISGLNLRNEASERVQTLNIDELQFDKQYIRFKRDLPNGINMELLIIKTDAELLKKYSGLTNLYVGINGVTVEAKL